MSETDKKTASDRGHHSELLSPAYWVGQVMIIIATVVGVYLAATVGFEKAVQFELTRADMDAHDLLVALEAEVLDNASVIDAYLAKFEKDGKKVGYSHKAGMPQIDKLIWEGMRYSPSTYDLPLTTINDIKGYYRRVESTLASLGAHYDNIEHPDWIAVEVKPFFNRLRKENEQLRTDMLPRINTVKDDLKKRLMEQGIKM